jgi:hypothetical protein
LTALDPVTRQSARLFHPDQDRWSDHFSWSDDSTWLQGLTPTGRATIDALQINRAAMITLRRYWSATGLQLEDASHDT